MISREGLVSKPVNEIICPLNGKFCKSEDSCPISGKGSNRFEKTYLMMAAYRSKVPNFSERNLD